MLLDILETPLGLFSGTQGYHPSQETPWAALASEVLNGKSRISIVHVKLLAFISIENLILIIYHWNSSLKKGLFFKMLSFFLFSFFFAYLKHCELKLKLKMHKLRTKIIVWTACEKKNPEKLKIKVRNCDANIFLL